jgi:type IV secretion system protein TrbL
VNLNQAVQLFYNAGVGYSTAIQPYAKDLLFGLFLIEIIVNATQYMIEGQLDPWHFAGRFVRQFLTTGFCWWMIVNGFTIMMGVINSFSDIGQALTGAPNLSPQGVLYIGINEFITFMNSPGTSSIISNIELGIVEAVCALIILGCFLLVAAELILLLVKAYITCGLGVILLGFGGSRYTSSITEGYFTNAVRLGVKLLFFYAVLGIGLTIVNQFQAALAAACNPVPATVGLLGSYYVPPSAIVTTVCSGTLSTQDFVNFVVIAVIFAVVVVFVPEYASDLVGGSLALGLQRAVEAAMLARTVSRITSPITGAIGGLARAMSGSDERKSSGETPHVQAAMATAAARAGSSASNEAATQPLSPFNGQQPGYNVRNGHALTASPEAAQNSGPGQLTYQPGKPGQHTKDIAVDITDLQERSGEGDPNDNDSA